MSAWQPIETAPKDGTRVRLAHEQDLSSMRIGGMCPTFGSFNGRTWDMSSYFVIPGGRHGLLTGVPTHWMPSASPDQIQETEHGLGGGV